MVCFWEHLRGRRWPTSFPSRTKLTPSRLYLAAQGFNRAAPTSTSDQRHEDQHLPDFTQIPPSLRPTTSRSHDGRQLRGTRGA